LQLLQPVVGISVAPLFLGEPFTVLLALATVITLVGVVLVQRR
jgi:drug/metabolite transporter (DMT)-like permease